jgi:serine/threonine-protein kinase HipA
MSMLGARDNDTRSYLDVVDALRQHGAAPREDMEVLWRRIVFSVLISNTDDHLRNHAFLYEGRNGWRLSPAYDLNPVPTDIKPRVLTTAITEDDTAASLDLVFTVAGYFEVTDERARTIAKEVAASASGWRAEAARQGITRPHIERMASAFEHKDMARARSL